MNDKTGNEGFREKPEDELSGYLLKQSDKTQSDDELNNQFARIARQAGHGFNRDERMTCESYIREQLHNAYESGRKHQEARVEASLFALKLALELNQSQQARVSGLIEALDRLQKAESAYRYKHDTFKGGDLAVGRAWDEMRHAGDRSREAIKKWEAGK